MGKAALQWTDEMLAELARQLGISKASVVAKRGELGIASVTAAGIGAFDWSDAAVALLGTASDAKVALQLGLSRLTVYNARMARGIAAAGRGGTGSSAEDLTSQP